VCVYTTDINYTLSAFSDTKHFVSNISENSSEGKNFGSLFGVGNTNYHNINIRFLRSVFNV
jgi:hypothetical protein